MSIRVAIIGLGWPGRYHTESLAAHTDAKVVAFADLDETRVRAHAQKYNARAYPDWSALLAGERELDAVILATPPTVRLEPIRAICRRRLALFCEKPPADSLTHALKVNNVIRRAGIIHTVGFQFRWSQAAAKLRELIAGRPRLFARLVIAWPVFSWVKAGGTPPTLYRKDQSGGPLIEQGIHYQDVLRYVTGDEPRRVMALAELGRTEPREGRDSEETTALICRHDSGMLTSHIHNWSHQGRLMQLQVVGEDFDLTWFMDAERDRLTGVLGGQAVEHTFPAGFYQDEIKGFVAAVKAGQQQMLRSTFADACQSLAVCDAASRAVLTGKAVTVRDLSAI